MFGRDGEMPLSRVDALCGLLRMDFNELARQLADQQPVQRELSLAQERAVVAEPKLLLVAMSCLSQWSFEQIVAAYRLDAAEVVRRLAELDRLGIIELRPHNRYKLRVAKTLRWRPNGPLIGYFREQVLHDFYAGRFDGDGELLTLVHGQLEPAHARELAERLRRVAEDFARVHLQDFRLPQVEKKPYTLVVAMRSWLAEQIRLLQR